MSRLHVVTDADIARAQGQSLAQRIAALQDEARALNLAQVAAMRASVHDGMAAASEVAANPTQPAGVRQAAESIAREIEGRLTTLDAIIGRAA